MNSSVRREIYRRFEPDPKSVQRWERARDPEAYGEVLRELREMAAFRLITLRELTDMTATLELANNLAYAELTNAGRTEMRAFIEAGRKK